MSLVTGKLESSNVTLEFVSAEAAQDVPSVLAGLANVQAQFNQYLTSSLHLNMEPENDEILPDDSNSEEDGEEKKVVAQLNLQKNRKKAKK